MSGKAEDFNSWAQCHRQLRLFISSTFVDMNEERDALVRIFPQISELCNKRGVEFVPLDLRWGINEDAAKEGRVVETCLREVDDARPFFIGIIGHRYGWMPNEDDLGNWSSELKKRYPWLKEAMQNSMSITEMEIQHAVLMRKDNEQMNAAFYLRSEKMPIPSSYKEISGSIAEQKLKRLKDAICGQKQFKAEHYDSVNELANMVLKDVTEFIDKVFPVQSVSSYDVDADLQERILKSRIRSLIPMDRYAPQIEGWVKGQSKRHLLITGHQGRGKSYLLASVVKQLRAAGNKVVYLDFSRQKDVDSSTEYWTGELLNLMGGTDRKKLERENNLGCILSLIWGIIKGVFSLSFYAFRAAFGNLEKAQQNLSSSMSNMISGIASSSLMNNIKHLKKALQKNPRTVFYVAFDNLDDLKDEEFPLLEFLREVEQIRFIYSASLNSKAQLFLQSRNDTDLLKIENLNMSQATSYVNNYLAQYGKELDAQGFQCRKLLKSGIAGNVQLLSYVLNLMVRFGSYEKLDNYINELSEVKDIKSMYELVLKSVLEQFGENSELNVVKDVIIAFAVVKEGLTESEVQKIFNLKPMQWAFFRPYLFSICKNKGDLWKPISNVCRSVILKNLEDRVEPVVDVIAKYFENTLLCSTEHKNVMDQPELYMYQQDRELLARQVQVLPVLYAERKRLAHLYYWATYLRADVLFTDSQRLLFWEILYKGGYLMRNVKDVDVPPHFKESIKRSGIIDIKGALFNQHKWLLTTPEEKEQLYNRWIVVASALKKNEDMAWLFNKSSNFNSVTGEYGLMFVQKKYDDIIERTEKDNFDNYDVVTRLSILFFVVAAYQEKGEFCRALDFSRKGVDDIINLQMENERIVLSYFLNFADLASRYGDSNDVDCALSLLMKHKEGALSKGVDNILLPSLFTSMASLHIRKGNYNQSINDAQMAANILSNMGRSSENAKKIIDRAKELQAPKGS